MHAPWVCRCCSYSSGHPLAQQRERGRCPWAAMAGVLSERRLKAAGVIKVPLDPAPGTWEAMQKGASFFCPLGFKAGFLLLAGLQAQPTPQTWQVMTLARG